MKRDILEDLLIVACVAYTLSFLVWQVWKGLH